MGIFERPWRQPLAPFPYASWKEGESYTETLPLALYNATAS